MLGLSLLGMFYVVFAKYAQRLYWPYAYILTQLFWCGVEVGVGTFIPCICIAYYR